MSYWISGKRGQGTSLNHFLEYLLIPGGLIATFLVVRYARTPDRMISDGHWIFVLGVALVAVSKIGRVWASRAKPAKASLIDRFLAIMKGLGYVLLVLGGSMSLLWLAKT